MDNLPNPQSATALTHRRHDEIAASLLNPRTAFDAADYDPDRDEALCELADSIATYGLIEPIVTSPAGVIIAGERRWRAIGLLIERGRWPADAPIPCIDRTLDDQDAIAVAVIENLQRQDVPPLDEARAFKRLIDDYGWTKETVASAIGKTVRHVEYRLDLVERLAEPVQAMVAAGEIPITAARVLATAPAEEQEAHALAFHRGEWGYKTTDDLKTRIAGERPHVSIAAFDPAEYERLGGTYIGAPPESDEDEDDRHFADLELFKGMQLRAAEARVENLRDGRKPYAFVELYNRIAEGNAYLTPPGYDWVGDNEKGDDIGALVILDTDWEVETRRYRKAAPAARRAAGGGGDAPPRPDFTKAHIAKANRIKTDFVASKVATHEGAALRLAILGLAGCHEVKISGGNLMKDDVTPERRDALEILKQDMPEALAKRYAVSISGETAAAAVWDWLAGLDDALVSDIFANLVARQFGSWNDHDPSLGDSPLFCAVAAHVKAALDPEWFAFDEEYLATLGKPRLLEILRASGTFRQAAEQLDGTTAALEGATAKRLREIVRELADEGALDHFTPRELRVGSAAELATPLPESSGTPEPPAQAEAAPAESTEDAPATAAPKKKAAKAPAKGKKQGKTAATKTAKGGKGKAA